VKRPSAARVGFGAVSGKTVNVLVVDDHDEIRKTLQTALDDEGFVCLLYTSPSPRDLSTSRMPSSA